MTDRAADLHFLRRAQQRGLISTPSEPIDSLMARKNFIAMLRERGLTMHSPMLEAIVRCSTDIRYSAVRTFGERKDAWMAFVAQESQRSRKENILQRRNVAEQFLKALSDAFENEPIAVLTLARCDPEALKRFEKDPRSQALPERERLPLVKTFFAARARRLSERKARKRKDALSKLSSELRNRIHPSIISGEKDDSTQKGNEPIEDKGLNHEEHDKNVGETNKNDEEMSVSEKNYFTDRTPFRELERVLTALPDAEFVDEDDISELIREWRRHVDSLIQERRSREREARKAVQRERQNKFARGVFEMIVEGRIAFSARWKDVYEEVERESFAIGESELGARSKDLFEYGMQLFDDEVQKYREEFKQLLREEKVEVVDGLSLENLRGRERLAAFMQNVKEPVLEAILVDRIRKENKRRQKELNAAVDEFEELMHSSELPIDTAFEAAVEEWKSRSAYKALHAIVGTVGVKKEYDDFVRRRKAKEERRLKRKYETYPAMSNGGESPVGVDDKSKRARVDGAQLTAPPFNVAPSLTTAAPGGEDENGWAAVVSEQPLTEAEKIAERERRKRELLMASDS